MDGIGASGNLISTGLPNFGSLVSMVAGFAPGAQTVGNNDGAASSQASLGLDYTQALADMREKLAACGIEVPESPNSSSFSLFGTQNNMQAAILDLSKLEEKENKRAQIEIEREADNVEVEKSKFFSKNSYAVDENGALILDENGRPQINYGVPEDAVSSAARADYEKEVKYQAQLAALDKEESYPAGSASAELMELYSNSDNLSAVMSTPEGQARLQSLMERANIESQDASIDSAAEQLKQTLPPDLYYLADDFASNCKGHMQTARNNVANSEEYAVVAALNAQMQEQITSMREQMMEKIKNFEGYQLEDLSIEYSI
ncbi:MAG: hypothetical protein ACI376_09345 [Candidatus Bruticola sp.]